MFERHSESTLKDIGRIRRYLTTKLQPNTLGCVLLWLGGETIVLTEKVTLGTNIPKTVIDIMPILPSQVALEVVVMTTYGAATDDKIGAMTTLGFQCIIWRGK